MNLKDRTILLVDANGEEWALTIDEVLTEETDIDTGVVNAKTVIGTARLMEVFEGVHKPK
jgi:hypothetical protein